MKYWRGYLVAAILAACAWGLSQFAASHWMLVDMVYPYVTRMLQNFMSNWSAGLDFCLWQLLVMALGVALLASIVLMIVFKWNVIQWFGWILTVPALLWLLYTGMYGMNQYAGPLADDIRLNVTDYTIEELEDATLYYRDQANQLATQVSRDSSGNPTFADLQTLAEQAAEGFLVLTYDHSESVFAGSTLPVKELGWSDTLASRGFTGVMMPLTGEAAVNPQTPAVGLPFAICRLMANRMCIANPQDSAMAAFLTCDANSSAEFRYSGYLMAYRYCCNALSSMTTQEAQQILSNAQRGENKYLSADLNVYNTSFAPAADDTFADALDEEAYGDEVELPVRSNVPDLLVSWYIQQIVLPQHIEEEVVFDPLDETQVDLSGLPHYKTAE